MSAMIGRNVCAGKGRRRYEATAPEAHQGWERLASPRGRRSSRVSLNHGVTGRGVYGEQCCLWGGSQLACGWSRGDGVAHARSLRERGRGYLGTKLLREGDREVYYVDHPLPRGVQ